MLQTLFLHLHFNSIKVRLKRRECSKTCRSYQDFNSIKVRLKRCSDYFHYEVYDGEKDILDEDGNVVDFHEPVYETAYFLRTL